MQIISFKFLLFILAVVFVYYIFPEKLKKVILLVANISFYAMFGWKSLVVFLIMILLSYCFGVFIKEKKNRYFLAMSIIVCLLPLLLINYCKVGISSIIRPVGISFFTFKMLSYMIDMYRGVIIRKVSLLDYAVYISFFPTIISGPIDRTEIFIKQINKKRVFDIDNLYAGFVMLLWGYIQKMIVADRLCIIVDKVYGNYTEYSGFVLIVTSVMYTLQIYFDFAGYTYIVLGIARMMGIECMENFRQPYYSKSIKEFWQRWHISLSSWLRDYVYIPLGGNRKGKRRKYLNLMLTFLVSGIWHGAGWNFVIWGLLHGAYQLIGEVLLPVRDKIKPQKLVQICVTFILVNIAWVFFRCTDGQALSVLSSMCHVGSVSLGWLWESVTKLELLVTFCTVCVVAVVDFLKYNEINVMDLFKKQPIVVRYLELYLMIFAILVFGIYGPGYDAASFIYFQF